MDWHYLPESFQVSPTLRKKSSLTTWAMNTVQIRESFVGAPVAARLCVPLREIPMGSGIHSPSDCRRYSPASLLPRPIRLRIKEQLQQMHRADSSMAKSRRSDGVLRYFGPEDDSGTGAMDAPKHVHSEQRRAEPKVTSLYLVQLQFS